MEWVILGLIIILLLPFYVYLLNKSAWSGKLMAFKQLFREDKEEKNGEKEE